MIMCPYDHERIYSYFPKKHRLNMSGGATYLCRRPSQKLSCRNHKIPAAGVHG
jgi:hypothetical protein